MYSKIAIVSGKFAPVPQRINLLLRNVDVNAVSFKPCVNNTDTIRIDNNGNGTVDFYYNTIVTAGNSGNGSGVLFESGGPTTARIFGNLILDTSSSRSI